MEGQPPETTQFYLFKDCIARKILQLQSAPSLADSEGEVDSLDEFSTYLATEAWSNLPESLNSASYANLTAGSIPDLDSPSLLNTLESTSTSFTDTLVSYGLASDTETALQFLRKVLVVYMDDATAPPPVWSSTRTKECEICEREVPLTYHHLIPKSVHDKVRKKRWHEEWMLNSVAWLCRPCHTAVHQFARCEELARNFYTVELLLEREEIQKWRKYAAKQRFGLKRR